MGFINKVFQFNKGITKIKAFACRNFRSMCACAAEWSLYERKCTSICMLVRSLHNVKLELRRPFCLGECHFTDRLACVSLITIARLNGRLENLCYFVGTMIWFCQYTLVTYFKHVLCTPEWPLFGFARFLFEFTLLLLWHFLASLKACQHTG